MDCNHATWTQAGAAELSPYTLSLGNQVTITHCRGKEGPPLLEAYSRLAQGYYLVQMHPWPRLLSPVHIHVSPFGFTLNIH